MAGDWLKIETITPDKPEVSNIAHRLGITPEEAFGRLFRVWSWCQNVSANGHVRVRDLSPVDRAAGLRGFGQAMSEEEWIQPSAGGFVIPKWDRHLSKGAKKRALDAERKRREREGTVPDPSASQADEPRTRVREESSSPSQKKGRAPSRTPRARMPDGFHYSHPEIIDYTREKGWPEGHLGLHWEVFNEAVAKGDLMYAGEKGWLAAFKKCIREDWGGIRAHKGTREAQQVSWLKELTGGGGNVIPGSAERGD